MKTYKSTPNPQRENQSQPLQTKISPQFYLDRRANTTQNIQEQYEHLKQLNLQQNQQQPLNPNTSVLPPSDLNNRQQPQKAPIKSPFAQQQSSPLQNSLSHNISRQNSQNDIVQKQNDTIQKQNSLVENQKQKQLIQDYQSKLAQLENQKPDSQRTIQDEILLHRNNSSVSFGQQNEQKYSEQFENQPRSQSSMVIKKQYRSRMQGDNTKINGDSRVQIDNRAIGDPQKQKERLVKSNSNRSNKSNRSSRSNKSNQSSKLLMKDIQYFDESNPKLDPFIDAVQYQQQIDEENRLKLLKQKQQEQEVLQQLALQQQQMQQLQETSHFRSSSSLQKQFSHIQQDQQIQKQQSQQQQQLLHQKSSLKFSNNSQCKDLVKEESALAQFLKQQSSISQSLQQQQSNLYEPSIVQQLISEEESKRQQEKEKRVKESFKKKLEQMFDIDNENRESTLKLVFDNTPREKKEGGSFIEYLHRTGSQPFTPLQNDQNSVDHQIDHTYNDNYNSQNGSLSDTFRNQNGDSRAFNDNQPRQWGRSYSAQLYETPRGQIEPDRLDQIQNNRQEYYRSGSVNDTQNKSNVTSGHDTFYKSQQNTPPTDYRSLSRASSREIASHREYYTPQKERLNISRQHSYYGSDKGFQEPKIDPKLPKQSSSISRADSQRSQKLNLFNNKSQQYSSEGSGNYDYIQKVQLARDSQSKNIGVKYQLQQQSSNDGSQYETNTPFRREISQQQSSGSENFQNTFGSLNLRPPSHLNQINNQLNLLAPQTQKMTNHFQARGDQLSPSPITQGETKSHQQTSGNTSHLSQTQSTTSYNSNLGVQQNHNHQSSSTGSYNQHQNSGNSSLIKSTGKQQDFQQGYNSKISNQQFIQNQINKQLSNQFPIGRTASFSSNNSGYISTFKNTQESQPKIDNQNASSYMSRGSSNKDLTQYLKQQVKDDRQEGQDLATYLKQQVKEGMFSRKRPPQIISTSQSYQSSRQSSTLNQETAVLDVGQVAHEFGIDRKQSSIEMIQKQQSISFNRTAIQGQSSISFNRNGAQDTPLLVQKKSLKQWDQQPNNQNKGILQEQIMRFRNQLQSDGTTTTDITRSNQTNQQIISNQSRIDYSNRSGYNSYEPSKIDQIRSGSSKRFKQLEQLRRLSASQSRLDKNSRIQQSQGEGIDQTCWEDFKPSQFKLRHTWQTKKDSRKSFSWEHQLEPKKSKNKKTDTQDSGKNTISSKFFRNQNIDSNQSSRQGTYFSNNFRSESRTHFNSTLFSRDSSNTQQKPRFLERIFHTQSPVPQVDISIRTVCAKELGGGSNHLLDSMQNIKKVTNTN